MKKLLAVPGLVLLALGLYAFMPTPGHGPVYRAELSGANEVPAVDTDASGRFEVRFARDFSSATFQMDLRNAVRVTQSHFHCGEEGLNGPVIVFLFGFHDRGWDIDGPFLRSVTVTDENIVNTACGSTLREIAQAMDEGRVYVNVHSVDVPSGLIRGQLRGN